MVVLGRHHYLAIVRVPPLSCDRLQSSAEGAIAKVGTEVQAQVPRDWVRLEFSNPLSVMYSYSFYIAFTNGVYCAFSQDYHLWAEKKLVYPI